MSEHFSNSTKHTGKDFLHIFFEDMVDNLVHERSVS